MPQEKAETGSGDEGAGHGNTAVASEDGGEKAKSCDEVKSTGDDAKDEAACKAVHDEEGKSKCEYKEGKCAEVKAETSSGDEGAGHGSTAVASEDGGEKAKSCDEVESTGDDAKDEAACKAVHDEEGKSKCE